VLEQLSRNDRIGIQIVAIVATTLTARDTTEMSDSRLFEGTISMPGRCHTPLTV
jgi:hypothetical protein